MVEYYYPCRREEITSVHSAEASFISRFLHRTFRVGTVCIMTGVPHDHLMQQKESLCQSDQRESGRDGRRLELWNERLQSNCVTAHLQSDAKVQQLGEATCLPSTTNNKAKYPHAERQYTNKQTNKQVQSMDFTRARSAPVVGTVSACSVFRFRLRYTPKTKNRGFNFLMCTHHSCSILLAAAIAKGTVTVQQSTCASCLFLFLFFFPTALPLSSSGLPLLVLVPGLNHDPTHLAGEMEAAGETHSSTVHLASCPACANPNPRVSQLAGPSANAINNKKHLHTVPKPEKPKCTCFSFCFPKAEA